MSVSCRGWSPAVFWVKEDTRRGRQTYSGCPAGLSLLLFKSLARFAATLNIAIHAPDAAVHHDEGAGKGCTYVHQRIREPAAQQADSCLRKPTFRIFIGPCLGTTIAVSMRITAVLGLDFGRSKRVIKAMHDEFGYSELRLTVMVLAGAEVYLDSIFCFDEKALSGW